MRYDQDHTGNTLPPLPESRAYGHTDGQIVQVWDMPGQELDVLQLVREHEDSPTWAGSNAVIIIGVSDGKERQLLMSLWHATDPVIVDPVTEETQDLEGPGAPGYQQTIRLGDRWASPLQTPVDMVLSVTRLAPDWQAPTDGFLDGASPISAARESINYLI